MRTFKQHLNENAVLEHVYWHVSGMKMQNVLKCALLKNDVNGNAILDHIYCYGT